MSWVPTREKKELLVHAATGVGLQGIRMGDREDRLQMEARSKDHSVTPCTLQVGDDKTTAGGEASSHRAAGGRAGLEGQGCRGRGRAEL